MVRRDGAKPKGADWTAQLLDHFVVCKCIFFVEQLNYT